MPDADFYRKVESEVEKGCPHEKDALYDAWANLRFYEQEYDEFPTRWPDEDGYDRQEQYRRTSAVMCRAVTLMTQDLYKHDPTRRLATPEGTDWLQRVYAHNAMSAKWQRADELATVGDFAAFQFSGTEDPALPIKVHLWGRDQLIVWVDPEDPTEVAAVATIDIHDGKRRLTLWTPDTVVYYETQKGDATPGSGGSAYREIRREDNPYREPPRVAGKPVPGDDDDDQADDGDDEPGGILPFSFVHFRYPAQKFETPGPGTALRRLNDWINGRFDWSGEGIRYLSKPIGVASGVAATWKPPSRIKPGSWITLQSETVDVTGNGPVPTLAFVTPPTEWVQADWTDLNNGLDHELQMHGLPPSVFRMVQSAAASGVALICEQAPLLRWVEGRQEPFSHYERRAAFTCLRVAAAHLRNHGHGPMAAKLEALVAAAKFNLRWGPLYMLLPGPERDQSDEWRVKMGLADQVTILMERDRLTEEEALEALQILAKRKRKLEAMGATPPAPPAPAKPGADDEGADDEGDDDETEDDDEDAGKRPPTKPKAKGGDDGDDG